jgi:dTDP-4-amino-4,6-dideoxygalactose transaminase
LEYKVSLPETEKAAAEVLSLPVHPGLTQADLETIVKTVNAFMGH